MKSEWKIKRRLMFKAADSRLDAAVKRWQWDWWAASVFYSIDLTRELSQQMNGYNTQAHVWPAKHHEDKLHTEPSVAHIHKHCFQSVVWGPWKALLRAARVQSKTQYFKAALHNLIQLLIDTKINK